MCVISIENISHFLHLDMSVAYCHTWVETYACFKSSVYYPEKNTYGNLSLLTVLMLYWLSKETKIILISIFTLFFHFHSSSSLIDLKPQTHTTWNEFSFFNGSSLIYLKIWGISQLCNNESAAEEKGSPFTVMNYYSFNLIMSFLYERASTPNHQMTVDVKYAQDNFFKIRNFQTIKFLS